MKNFKIILLIVWSLTILSATSLDIYILNPEEDRGNEGIFEIIKSSDKSNNPSVIIDSRVGDILFRGQNSELKDKIKKFYGGNKEDKNDIPYTLNSIHKLLLPNNYSDVNLYFINSIFYKDTKFDFNLGFPNDAFLTSLEASFVDIKSFDSLKVHTYIINDKKLFIDAVHKKAMRRFYAILADRLKLDLQVFNTTFSTTKEEIKVDTISPNSSIQKLAILKKPPIERHYEIDLVDVTQDSDKIEIKLRNKDRAGMSMFVSMNGVSLPVTCNTDGECIFKTTLRLGKNILTLNKLDGTEYKREFISNYIPNDDGECYVLDNVLTLRVMKSFRPENDIVKLNYIEDNKEYNTTVKGGYYEFKIPLKYANNRFALKQYSGGISICSGANQKIQEENERQRIAEEERIAKLNKEAEIKRQKILAKKQKELEKKREEMAKKRASTAINNGTNKISYDNETLISNYYSRSLTKETYPMDLNKPMKIDTFFLKECDGDNEGDDRNSFDIYIEDEDGNRKMIAQTVHASGDDVCKEHTIKNPFPDFKAIRIIVDPIGTLGPIGSGPTGGAWSIENASIKYAKEQN